MRGVRAALGLWGVGLRSWFVDKVTNLRRGWQAGSVFQMATAHRLSRVHARLLVLTSIRQQTAPTQSSHSSQGFACSIWKSRSVSQFLSIFPYAHLDGGIAAPLMSVLYCFGMEGGQSEVSMHLKPRRHPLFFLEGCSLLFILLTSMMCGWKGSRGNDRWRDPLAAFSVVHLI